ncbi:MAG TPA: thiamine pyrophosphate-dependent dehydrogenase E1 component subunit alpha [Casimicrobiaceae bacterium]|nr:thiamine pyrophosphate-dependent dehydrogenase E1 component subunit alpha [Casimicrobiaceae bacterium]
MNTPEAKAGALAMLERMHLIRAYEHKLVELQQAGAAAGTCTSVGQEAGAVGVVHALAAEDTILTNHRSAAHLLARGASPARMMAEVMGRATGYCKGKSGSLHISVKELGVVLTSTIVGGELSLVTGVALSKTMLREDGITAVFFGDGASCEGIFHESLNLAALWKLPILYVAENNQWQAFVHRREAMAAESVAAHAAPYGIEARTVDGNDVQAVHEAARAAAAAVRATGRPLLLEVLTYRLRGHFEPDDQSYVDPAELAHWKARDPIELAERRLRDEHGVSVQELELIAHRAKARIEDAAAFAAASPMPDAHELTTDVYA